MSRRLDASQGVALVLVLLVGLAVGFVARAVFFTPAPPAPTAAPNLVRADPSALVVQPRDVPSSYRIAADPNAPEPGQTHPKAHYSVTLSRNDSSRYLAQCAVAVYSSTTAAQSALKTLLGLGQFGTELPLLAALGEDGHLFAANDPKSGVVVGSVLWRDRNVVAYIFVYNPYEASTPAAEIERLARGNAYDDTFALASRTEEHIKAG